jgi:hypothetical protein
MADSDEPGHDQLFKLLITNFFTEFVDLLLPAVMKYLDTETIEFQPMELFTDLTSGESHKVDVLVKARFRGTDTCFLIHVENQASSEAAFNRRMFRYFGRLHDRFDLPIYPVALFSYDAPMRPEPSRYDVEFPNLHVIDFRFRVLQLNRMPWRRYVNTSNPVAAALMTKMRIAPSDRRRVKLEWVRLLATLSLNPAKARLISTFIYKYLKLSDAETDAFRRDLSQFEPGIKERAMLLTNEWIEEGRKEGEHAATLRYTLHLLLRHFEAIPDAVSARLSLLTIDQLESLGYAQFRMSSLAEVEHWLESELSTS